jgi:hypothetical protein
MDELVSKPHALNAPGLAGRVERLHDLYVEILSLPEQRVCNKRNLVLPCMTTEYTE